MQVVKFPGSLAPRAKNNPMDGPSPGVPDQAAVGLEWHETTAPSGRVEAVQAYQSNTAALASYVAGPLESPRPTPSPAPSMSNPRSA
jgi:hypothetical protein